MGRTWPDGYWYSPAGSGERTYYTSDRIVPFRDTVNLEDPYRLLSPLSAARYDISANKQSAEWNDALLRNWGMPAGAWSADPTAEVGPQDKKFITRALRALRGPRNQGKQPVLPAGLKWQQLSMTQKDADWIGTRKVSRMTVAAVMGEPMPHDLQPDLVRGEAFYRTNCTACHGEKGDGQWLRAKGSDTFLPLGPCLVTADELGDPGDLAVRGYHTPAQGPDAGRERRVQDGRTSDMVFGVAELIAFVSASITLEPGDLVITGTPPGVGAFRDPPVFLEPGDVVPVEVVGIGSLTNPIVDADGEAPAGSPAERLFRARRAGSQAGPGSPA